MSLIINSCATEHSSTSCFLTIPITTSIPPPVRKHLRHKWSKQAQDCISETTISTTTTAKSQRQRREAAVTQRKTRRWSSFQSIDPKWTTWKHSSRQVHLTWYYCHLINRSKFKKTSRKIMLYHGMCFMSKIFVVFWLSINGKVTHLLKIAFWTNYAVITWSRPDFFRACLFVSSIPDNEKMDKWNIFSQKENKSGKIFLHLRMK